jgi:sugar phosphate permease
MKATSPPASVTTARLRRWQVLTIGLMVAGYSGYYLCRSNFSIALPMLLDDLAARGVNPERARLQLGMIASAGTLAYAVGKFLSGGIADTLGGRWNMLAGMLGAVVCTLLFAAGGTLPVFTVAWVGNRFVQSLGWPGMVKITGHWFASSTHGRVMGIVSLSYLFGDAAARAFLGRLIKAGLGWRGLFVVAASTLASLLVASAWLLRESPTQIGEPEPEPEPKPKPDPLDALGELPAPGGLAGPLATLLRSPAFWLVGLLSLGLTLLRETFNTWTPTYFVEGVGLSTADAAATSALFPLAGGVSVLLTGYLADRLGRSGRAAIILAGMVLAGAAMATLGGSDFGGSQRWPVGLVTATAFLLIGPYSFLAGAIALDLGGKHGSATASGWIDGIGYLGGILAGGGMARVAAAQGWRGAFMVLALVAWTSSVVAALFLVDQWRTVREPVR